VCLTEPEEALEKPGFSGHLEASLVVQGAGCSRHVRETPTSAMAVRRLKAWSGADICIFFEFSQSITRCNEQ
jgi:hypothetical protein